MQEYFLSVVAGLATFVSPCLLPLLPAYIFYITGIKTSEANEKNSEYIIKILFFILGFSLVFITLGLLTGILTFYIGKIRFYLNIIFGIIIIILALNFMGVFKFLFLNKEKRFKFEELPHGNLGSLLFGMSFAAGWTPCIGPVLASIISLAASTNSFYKALFMLIFYSLGLAIPFFLTALFFNKLKPLLDFFKKHTNIIRIISGSVLLLIGILIMSGSFSLLSSMFYNFALFLKNNETLSSIITGLFLILIALSLIIYGLLKKKKITVIINAIIIVLGILIMFKIIPLIDLLSKYLTSS